MRPRVESTLSLSQAALRLGLSAPEVLDLIEEGELRFIPSDDVATLRVPESAIEDLFEHWSA